MTMKDRKWEAKLGTGLQVSRGSRKALVGQGSGAFPRAEGKGNPPPPAHPQSEKEMLVMEHISGEFPDLKGVFLR